MGKWCCLLACTSETPNLEAATTPTVESVTSNSISITFQTETPIIAGTEQFYKYYVQYRVTGSSEWTDSGPGIAHPEGLSLPMRATLYHTIVNLAQVTSYDIQIALCREQNGLKECYLAQNPVVVIRTLGYYCRF